jgi:membrane protein implicated in regulation of membrane protease activity
MKLERNQHKTRAARRPTFWEWLVIIPWTPLVALALFFFVPWYWALPIYLLVSVISILIAWESWRAIRLPAASGRDALIGQTAVALTEIGPTGQVRLRGEIWSARTRGEDPIAAGERVQIVGVEGLIVVVERAGELSV